MTDALSPTFVIPTAQATIVPNSAITISPMRARTPAPDFRRYALTVSPFPEGPLTPTPLYRLYSPGMNSFFRFEFEYPSRWVIDEFSNYASWSSISFYELVSSGSYIFLDVDKQGASRKNELIDQILGWAKYPQYGGKVLEDKVVSIDGHEARQILLERPPKTYDDLVEGGESEKMVEFNVVLTVGDDGYWFHLLTPEREKDSRFAQEFRTMIMGMKYIP